MSRKAKTCCGCYANELDTCTLGYEVELYDLSWGAKAVRPIVCCHKPKTLKEYYDRLISECEVVDEL